MSNPEPNRSVRGLVIVPAYNEEASIAQVVGELRRCVPDFDIVVVDDGSTDRTYAHVPKDVMLIRLPYNLGIGGAMQAGYRYAAMRDYDLAIQVDGDGQHPAEEVSKLTEPLVAGEADMVIGSRFLIRGEYNQTPVRMTGIVSLRTLLRLLTGKTYTDCTSGFRAVNRSVIDQFVHWYPEDYPEPEVVLLLDRAGYRIKEISVTMQQRRRAGRTSIPFLWGVFYVIKVAAALLLDTIRHPWPEREEDSL